MSVFPCKYIQLEEVFEGRVQNLNDANACHVYAGFSAKTIVYGRAVKYSPSLRAMTTSCVISSDNSLYSLKAFIFCDLALLDQKQ